MPPRILLALAVLPLTVVSASAQVLGTFPWQMQPYCNIVTLTLTSTPAGFTLEGVDDQCGSTNKGSVVGMASFNASGNVTLNFTIGTPAAQVVQVNAIVSPATGDGTWADGDGHTGAFRFFAATGGLPPRPDGSSVRFRVTDANDLVVGANGSVGTLTWAVLSYNVGGGTYLPATGAYTVPLSGTYLITASARVNAPSVVNGFYCLALGVAGVSVHFECAPQTSTPLIPNMTTVRALNAGDALTIRANNGASTPQTFNGTINTSEFTVTRLK
jgi:hypothetical protein